MERIKNFNDWSINESVREFQDCYLVVDGDLTYLIEKEDTESDMKTAKGRPHGNWKLPSQNILESMQKNADQLKLNTSWLWYVGVIIENDTILMTVSLPRMHAVKSDHVTIDRVLTRLVNTDPKDLKKYRGSIHGAKFGI